LEITVYADVLLVVNFLIDYLLLLFCARLSGRRIIRKRLLAGALVGALTSLVIFLPPLSFWPMTLLKAGIAVLMVRLAYPWLSWRVFFRDSFLFFTVSFLLAGICLGLWLGLGTAGVLCYNGVTYFDVSLGTLLLSMTAAYLVLTVYARFRALPSGEQYTAFLSRGGRPLRLAAIRDSEELTDYLQRKKLGWVQYPELIKKLYILLTDSDFYRQYMNGSTGSFKGDAALVEKFYTRIVCECEALEEVIEEQSIFWTDDVDFATIMVLRTLSDMREGRQELPLLPQYKSDDDREYVRELFRHALVHFREYAEYIGRYTSNWEVERIAFMDNVIMVAAMSELIAFPSIPVKVTLDEFIEIAKYYSTPGSSTFINGVLDKVVEALTAEKRIQKTGRGLLDK